jgi:DNA-binding transcriptional ArsR family regulator
MENSPSMEERQSSTGTDPARDATPAEARALSHPLRLRILRLVIDEALTNRQLAERLARDPGTVLYHVRQLVQLGFLKAEPTRRGPSGHLEQPYRITGKSWTLRIKPERSWASSVLEATREELAEAGKRSTITLQRLGVRLGDADVAELKRRLHELADDFAARDSAAGRPVSILFLAHRRRA